MAQTDPEKPDVPPAKPAPPVEEYYKRPTKDQQRASLSAGKGRIPQHPPALLDSVLRKFSGNRKLASQHLGITGAQLDSKIRSLGLADKWGRQAGTRRLNAAELGLLPDGDTTVLDPACQSVALAYENLLNLSYRVLGSIRRTEERLIKGDDARLSDDPAQKKHAFRLTANGDPAEERMLMTHLENLFGQFRMITAEFRVGMTTKFKLDEIRRTRQAAGSNGGQRVVAGFRPKSEMWNANNIVADNVIFQAPGETLAKNDN